MEEVQKNLNGRFLQGPWWRIAIEKRVHQNMLNSGFISVQVVGHELWGGGTDSIRSRSILPGEDWRDSGAALIRIHSHYGCRPFFWFARPWRLPGKYFPSKFSESLFVFLKSESDRVQTVVITKTCLSAADNTRCTGVDCLLTLACGHWRLNVWNRWTQSFFLMLI